MNILTGNFQDMTIWVNWDHLEDLLSPGPTLHHFSITYHDNGHPINTDPYELVKNYDIDMKLSGSDHSGNLRSFRKPTLPLSNLTSLSHGLSWPWSPNYNKYLWSSWKSNLSSHTLPQDNLQCITKFIWNLNLQKN